MKQRNDGPVLTDGRVEEKGTARRPLRVGLALAVLAALFAASCGGATGETGDAGGADQQDAEKAVEEEPEAGSEEPAEQAELDHPYLGDPGAPVVLVEYADFQ